MHIFQNECVDRLFLLPIGLPLERRSQSFDPFVHRLPVHLDFALVKQILRYQLHMFTPRIVAVGKAYHEE